VRYPSFVRSGLQVKPKHEALLHTSVLKHQIVHWFYSKRKMYEATRDPFVHGPDAFQLVIKESLRSRQSTLYISQQDTNYQRKAGLLGTMNALYSATIRLRTTLSSQLRRALQCTTLSLSAAGYKQ